MKPHTINQTVYHTPIKSSSISFTDLSYSSSHHNPSLIKENLKSIPNRQTRPRLLHLSLNEMLKEKKAPLEDLNIFGRRTRLQQLSYGYKIKKENLIQNN